MQLVENAILEKEQVGGEWHDRWEGSGMRGGRRAAWQVGGEWRGDGTVIVLVGKCLPITPACILYTLLTCTLDCKRGLLKYWMGR